MWGCVFFKIVIMMIIFLFVFILVFYVILDKEYIVIVVYVKFMEYEGVEYFIVGLMNEDIE